MKIQVLGANGMLGGAVVLEATAAGHTVISKLFGPIESMLPQNIDGEVVINCAGMVKQNKTSPWIMVSSNAVGPHRVAAMAEIARARLIHISTDCVFRGKGPHDEEDTPDATDLYARSKLAGEVTYGPHLTIRTSFVGFGTRGLATDLSKRRAVTVSQNLLWTGHTVDTIAKLLVWLAEHPHVTGLLHVPGDEQTRYTLARDLKSRWNLPAILERDDEFVADRRLISGKWTYLGLPTLPSFETQLATMRGPDDGF